MRQLAAALLAIATIGVDAQAQRTIRPGTTIEVIRGSDSLRGEAISTSPSLLVLRTDHGVDSVALASITRWHWRGTGAVRGLTYGGLTGGASLAALGALAGAAFCEYSCENASMQGAVVFGGLGVVIGGTAGAILGSLVPVWHEAKGSPIAVRESPLTSLPVKVHAMRGVTSLDNGAVWQAGAQYTRGDYRFGAELGKLELGRAYSLTIRDSRPISSTDVETDGGQFGVVAERRLIGPLWAEGAVMQQWSRERTRVIDLSDIGSPTAPRNVVMTFRDESGFGGSVGLVLRRRVIGDVWLRVNARQRFGPTTLRTMSAGVEL